MAKVKLSKQKISTHSLKTQPMYWKEVMTMLKLHDEFYQQVANESIFANYEEVEMAFIIFNHYGSIYTACEQLDDYSKCIIFEHMLRSADKLNDKRKIKKYINMFKFRISHNRAPVGFIDYLEELMKKYELTEI